MTMDDLRPPPDTEIIGPPIIDYNLNSTDWDIVAQQMEDALPILASSYPKLELSSQPEEDTRYREGDNNA